MGDFKSKALDRKWRQLVKKAGQDPSYERLESSRELPLTVYRASTRPKWLCFITKDALCRRWLVDETFPKDLMAFTRPSIPSEQDIDEVMMHLLHFKVPLLFVGDLDPLDLTIFAMLRSALRPRARSVRALLHYAGIDDRWLRLGGRFRQRAFSLDDVTCAMGQTEREHLQFVLDLIPDLHEVVGPRSLQLLQSGRKLEIEGACAPGVYGEEFPGRLLRHFRRIAK